VEGRLGHDATFRPGAQLRTSCDGVACALAQRKMSASSASRPRGTDVRPSPRCHELELRPTDRYSYGPRPRDCSKNGARDTGRRPVEAPNPRSPFAISQQPEVSDSSALRRHREMTYFR
jgi:hypothetical protein